MSGKGGRCGITFLWERLWRSIKYEEVYLNQYTSYEEAYISLETIFNIITLNVLMPR